MTPAIRILDTGLAPARWNVAMTAALTQRHSDGKAPDTLRFHRYRTCALIGNGQRLSDAIDVACCRQRGIEIARRVTGGGAVFMSPRMLAWDVVVDRSSHAGGLEGITRRICEAVAAGLTRLGAPARFDPPNAVTTNGAKISGSSGYVEGRSAVLQGTVLIEDHTAEMAAVLGLAEATLRQRVSCLAASLETAPALADVQAALVASLAVQLQRLPIPSEPDDVELASASQLLHDEIGTEDYVAGTDARALDKAAP
jgi:lipoate-protein ligase A